MSKQTKKVTLKTYGLQIWKSGKMERFWFTSDSMASAIKYKNDLKTALNADSAEIIVEVAPIRFGSNVLRLKRGAA